MSDLASLSPTGTLRCGVVVAPAASAFFAIAPDGAPRGVTVDLFHALGRDVNAPLDLVLFPNSGELTEATAKGEIDVAFMPQDAERAAKVDFGPPYILIESTFLVPAGSKLTNLNVANFPGARAVAIAGTTTGRSARRFLTNGTVEDVRGVGDMLRMAKAGEADLFALSRDSFATLLPDLPGARVLEGNFQEVGVAVAVPKGRAAALARVTVVVETVKRNGLVRAALDRAGVGGCVVAPLRN
jgi:polar amino acid transport system substrate-binding protein